MHVSMWRSQTKGRLTCVITMFKLTKRFTLFQCKHALEFSLEIVEFEKKGNTSVVTNVHCLFYVYHDCDVGATSHKCKSTDNIHIFKALFIKQHYLSHLKQHAKKGRNTMNFLLTARSNVQTQCTYTLTPAKTPSVSLSYCQSSTSSSGNYFIAMTIELSPMSMKLTTRMRMTTT